MIRRSVLAAVATVTLQVSTVSAAVSGVEQGSDGWNELRAEIFAQVCMGSAPNFTDVDAKAEAAGLVSTKDGWHMAPEVLIRVLEHDGFCSCFMTMQAPDQSEMMAGIFDQLMAGYGDHFTGPNTAITSVAPFDFDGTEVVSILEPRSFNGDPWIAARLSVFGSCATGEASQ